MTTKLDAGALSRAAEAHGEATGDADAAIGDLEILLQAALDLLTPSLAERFLKLSAVVDLAELPEYADALAACRALHPDHPWKERL